MVEGNKGHFPEDAHIALIEQVYPLIPKDSTAIFAWQEVGIDICVEIIQQVGEIPGVAGVYIMAIEWEVAVPRIVERAGLLPRPAV